MVLAEFIGCWIHSLSMVNYTVISLARKLIVLRGLVRYLQWEKLCEDDFIALLSSSKYVCRILGTLIVDEVVRLLAVLTGGDALVLRDCALLELFYFSGLRVFELVVLNIQQFNLE
jgi:Site-specific recombinase XerD